MRAVPRGATTERLRIAWCCTVATEPIFSRTAARSSIACASEDAAEFGAGRSLGTSHVVSADPTSRLLCPADASVGRPRTSRLDPSEPASDAWTRGRPLDGADEMLVLFSP